MQKLSKGMFPWPSCIRWTGGLTSGSFISLQTIPWMDARCWIITEPGSSWNFALEMASSMQESPTAGGADFRKLDFHFNASLAAVNLAKAACKRLGITYSISSCESFIHNAYMLERFICVFGINPDMQVIDKLFKELILFTARAA